MRLPVLLLAAITAAGLSPSVVSAAILVPDPSDSTVLSRIEDFEFMGMTYNIDLTRAVDTFNEIFGTGDPPATLPTFYNEHAAAAQASDAILSLLNSSSFTSVGVAGSSAVNVGVPARALAIDPNVRFRHNYGMYDGFVWQDRTADSGSSSGADVPRTAGGWGIAVFSKVPEVPEVSSLATWGLMMLTGLGFRLRRRELQT